MLRDNIYIHPPSFLFLCLWECDISIEGRRPGHRTEYSAHVFNVKTSPAGSCSIFPQSTWALCPKRWDFLCIQVTGCQSELSELFDWSSGLVVRWKEWSGWPAWMICFQKICGFRALNHQIIEKSWDVTPVHILTHGHWKVEQYSVLAESAISVDKEIIFSLAAHAPEQTCRHCLPNCEEVRIWTLRKKTFYH